MEAVVQGIREIVLGIVRFYTGYTTVGSGYSPLWLA